jgi:hypothetical protein
MYMPRCVAPFPVEASNVWNDRFEPLPNVAVRSEGLGQQPNETFVDLPIGDLFTLNPVALSDGVYAQFLMQRKAKMVGGFNSSAPFISSRVDLVSGG